MSYISRNRIRMSYKGIRDFIEMNGGPVVVRDDHDNHHLMNYIPPQMYWVDIPENGGLLKSHFHKYDDKPVGIEGVDFLRQIGGDFYWDMFEGSHPDADAMIVAVDHVDMNDQFNAEQLVKDSDRDWGNPKAAVIFLTGDSKNETKEIVNFNTSTGKMEFADNFTNVQVGDIILIASKGWADASVITQPTVGSTIVRSKALRTPWCYMDLADAKTVCANRGTGFHLTMNHQWWDICVWMILNGYVPLGNDNGDNGPNTPPRSDIDNSVEWLIDPVSRVLNNTYNRALSGSGGPQSGHNLSLASIMDLTGNVWKWVDGLYINAGVIYVSKKPNPVYPGDYINTGLNIANGGLVVSDQDIKSIRFEKSLLGHGIPHETGVSESGYNNDHILYNALDTRGALRGSRWNALSKAGAFALGLYGIPSFRASVIGFRAALVK